MAIRNTVTTTQLIGWFQHAGPTVNEHFRDVVEISALFIDRYTKHYTIQHRYDRGNAWR